MSGEFTIPPPGLFTVEIINLGPVLDPPFSDTPDYRAYLPSVTTSPVAVQESSPAVDEEAARRAAELALASEDVNGHLAGRRHQLIGVGSAADNREVEYPLVVVYDYTENVVLEVGVDLQTGRVRGVARRHYQPVLSAEEERQAVELVREDGRLADHVGDPAAGAGLIVEDVNIRSPRYRHRLVDLRFGPRTRRLPAAYAIVDLTDRDVVSAGPVPQFQEGPS
ncbi:hypothetical protein [Kitasatospora cinereorecta]|uniref:Uncharacterized protein n=1 Tax=Kitasatospora cinereorecta TaxID=285560 RepID=A0ABW0VJ32_9ACTN